MFKLLKWIIVIIVCLSFWITYDFYTNLSYADKKLVGKELIDALDGSPPESLKERFHQKIENTIKGAGKGLKDALKNIMRRVFDAPNEEREH
jgi:hypothetical protein